MDSSQTDCRLLRNSSSTTGSESSGEDLGLNSYFRGPISFLSKDDLQEVDESASD